MVRSHVVRAQLHEAGINTSPLPFYIFIRQESYERVKDQAIRLPAGGAGQDA